MPFESSMRTCPPGGYETSEAPEGSTRRNDLTDGVSCVTASTRRMRQPLRSSSPTVAPAWLRPIRRASHEFRACCGQATRKDLAHGLRKRRQVHQCVQRAFVERINVENVLHAP